MGHEAFGTIDAVGARVSPARLGELVVVEPNIVCFTCDQCLVGRTSACRDRRSVGMNRQGALAESLVVPSAFAWSAPPVDASSLVCIEPLTVVETALRRVGPTDIAPALVVGLGPQGLLMTLALLRRGIEVHAIDLDPERMALAGSLGAHPTTGEASAERFGFAVDTVGATASLRTTLDSLAIGGSALLLGLEGGAIDIAGATVVRRQLRLAGSLTYDHPADFEKTVALVAEEAVDPGLIITDEVPLEDVQRAFESSGSARGKTWIRIGR